MFQVGWVKADTKAIQAIHDHVITHNQRVSVSHSDHSMWNLHIKGVQKEDGGLYMCQINTDPMKSQVCTSLSFYKRYGPIYTVRGDCRFPSHDEALINPQRINFHLNYSYILILYGLNVYFLKIIRRILWYRFMGYRCTEWISQFHKFFRASIIKFASFIRTSIGGRCPFRTHRAFILVAVNIGQQLNLTRWKFREESFAMTLWWRSIVRKFPRERERGRRREGF